MQDAIGIRPEGMRMTAYHFALTLHIFAAVGLFCGGAMIHLAMFKMRSATTVQSLREWARVGSTLDPVMPFIALILLGAALFMVHDSWSWSTRWIDVALGAFIVLVPMGPLFIAPRLLKVAKAADATPDGPVTAELDRLRSDRVLWTIGHTLTVTLFGAVCVMVFKPGLGPSLAVLAVSVALGALSAQPFVRREQGSPALIERVPVD
jgi:hypothetical protein